MTDIVGPDVRSRMMSLIRSRNTRPEILVRSGLWLRGFRFRLHAKHLAGRPDLVLPKWRTAIFVNGCFWHAHANCNYFRMPKSRTVFWQKKLHANRNRDTVSVDRLVQEGWKVIIIWECALKADPEKTILIAEMLICQDAGPCWEIAQAPSAPDTCFAQPYPLAKKIVS